MSHDFSRMPVWQETGSVVCQSATVESSEGVPYLIQFSVPEGPVPEAGFPAMLVLDGGHHFAAFAAMARRLAQRADVTGVADMVIIGVESVPAHGRRGVDFRPWGQSGEKESKSDEAEAGADRFAAFLVQDVLGSVGKEVALDRDRLSLAAHSLAGYFALYLAAKRPGLFATVGSFSPSLWQDEPRMRSLLLESPLEATRIFLSVGSREQDARRVERKMVDHARELAASLEGRAKDVKFVLAADEDHASSPFAVFPAFLRFVGRG